MRIAALYDIHGNLPALEAVMREVLAEGVDQLFIGGDVVPGPMPRETIAFLRALDLPVHFIHGNGDREVVALRRGGSSTVPEQFREVMRWNAEQLRPEDAHLLGNWPDTLSLEIEGLGQVLFCHATPRNDTEVFTRLTAEEKLLPVFAEAGAALVVCGHTHMQFDRVIAGTRVVNAGSVGMPFGEPGAYWLLLGPQPQFRCTRYDFEEAAGRIRATSYPQAEDFAAHNVLQPPAEETMLQAFARAELK